MAVTRDVAVLVGSLRKGAYSRRLALALAKLALPELRLEIVGIGDLPFYNQDLEDHGTPPSWRRFRDRIRAADGVLFVTPEYNRSIPGALKNAVDVGSRPYGQGVWAGKPGAVVSASPGAIGGFGANQHLRQTLAAVGVPVLPQPEIYIGGVDKLVDDEGDFANESTSELLKRFIGAFGRWIERNHAG